LNTEAILAEICAQRDRLSRAIAALEGTDLLESKPIRRTRRRVVPATPNPPAVAAAGPAAVKNGQLAAKTQPEAARALLEIAGHPLKTVEIVQGLERGGLKVGGKTLSQKKKNLYVVLYKHQTFRRSAADTWALRAGNPKNQRRKAVAQ